MLPRFLAKLLTRLALVAGLTFAVAAPGMAQEPAPSAEMAGVWTVVIPQAFPLHIFVWRVADDGTYREDGRNAISGRRTQVFGRWTRTGIRMVMSQNDEGFVFDGTVSGGCYIGRLFQDGKNISSFTARKRGSNVRHCDGDETI